jgi:hypothetical protein
VCVGDHGGRRGAFLAPSLLRIRLGEAALPRYRGKRSQRRCVSSLDPSLLTSSQSARVTRQARESGYPRSFSRRAGVDLRRQSPRPGRRPSSGSAITTGPRGAGTTSTIPSRKLRTMIPGSRPDWSSLFENFGIWSTPSSSSSRRGLEKSRMAPASAASRTREGDPLQRRPEMTTLVSTTTLTRISLLGPVSVDLLLDGCPDVLVAQRPFS